MYTASIACELTKVPAAEEEELNGALPHGRPDRQRPRDLRFHTFEVDDLKTHQNSSCHLVRTSELHWVPSYAEESTKLQSFAPNSQGESECFGEKRVRYVAYRGTSNVRSTGRHAVMPAAQLV